MLAAIINALGLKPMKHIRPFELISLVSGMNLQFLTVLMMRYTSFSKTILNYGFITFFRRQQIRERTGSKIQ
jgi:hypothetical protein